MVAVQRGLLVLMAAGALSLPSQIPIASDGAETPTKNGRVAAPAYGAGQREAYLTPDELDYIRPGLNVKINSVANVAAGQKPVVDFSLTDDFGNPLDRTGATTVGTVTYRFTVATWDGLYYTNQIGLGGNPSRDNTGKTDTIDVGHYKYTFFNAMPSTFDNTKPTTLFAGVVRNTTAQLGKNFYVNTFKDGSGPELKTAATTWGQTTTARCNQCHDPLALHGGNYREAKTCAICHNPNNMVGQIPGSGGEPAEERSDYNGQSFWHRIHSNNFEELVGEITYPQLVQKCETCHDTTKQANGTPNAPLGTTFMTEPSRAACGGCHADVNFATGEGHPGGPQANDTNCKDCHVPDSGNEWDASIKGAHVLPADSKQLKGLNIAILSVTNTAPGQKPTVTFKITENDGTFVKPSSATGGASATLVLAGTTTDYGMVPISQTATTAATYDAATGVCTYNFTTAIPADATGTWTMSAATRRTVTLNKASGGTRTFTEGPKENPIYDFAVKAGTAVTHRRVAVSLSKCNACHNRLATTFSHGGQRISIQFCVMCHNPVNSDITRRPADHSADPGESIEMARMIHRIHTGEELTQPYVIYGNSGQPGSFNEVTYPGDRRNCLACHASATTYDLPMPAGTLNVITQRDYFTPQGPGTAACTGCHDNRDVLAHAYLNTSPFGEACGTCHGTGADWAVDKVHAR